MTAAKPRLVGVRYTVVLVGGSFVVRAFSEGSAASEARIALMQSRRGHVPDAELETVSITREALS